MNEESVFAAVLEKPTPQERQAFLESACQSDPSLRERVEQLLAGHACQSGILDQGGAGEYLQGKSAGHTNHTVVEGAGSLIGPYKLKELIGEGGFGLVYVAEQQEPLRRYVALKLIKPGMDSREIIARFEAERQALALMDHPNIARVLDAGTVGVPALAGSTGPVIPDRLKPGLQQGRPYFVMELVRGVAITEFCDQGRLSTPDRLSLFITVCQAVQHAHQKGIIHRDLKPSNVLVTRHDDKPVVKVIDFGIAKALHQRLTDRSIYTRFAQMMGTPSYMSPEQAEMSGLDVDTRSDIYSLGVLLYELMTGTTPFERNRLETAGLDEWRRILREEEPVRPSTRISTLGMAVTTVSTNRRSDPRQLSQLFRGELDWIAMKALEKDRDRRYATAADMARDVERYLRNEPVEASPPSSVYRMRKFLRRHRGPVLAALLIFIVLVGGVIGTSLGMLRAANRAEEEARQRHRAELAETDAKANAIEAKKTADVALGLVQFLRKDLLGQAGVQSQALGQSIPNPNLTVREALDRAVDSFGDQFKDQPEVEAAIRYTMGIAYRQLGQYDKAIIQLCRTVELRSQTQDALRPQFIDTQHNLALAYRDAGRTKEAINLYQQVRDAQIVVLGAEHAHTLTTLDNLAVAYRDAGRRAEALELFKQVRDARVKTLGPDDPATLCTLHNIATMHFEAGDMAKAVNQLEKVRDAKVRVLGPEHLDTLPTLSNLAAAYWKSNQFAKSIPILENLVPAYQKLLGETHPLTYGVLANLGVNYRDAGRLDEAISLLQKAYQGSRHNASLRWVVRELQIAYVRTGRTKEAVALIKEMLASSPSAMKPDSLEYALTLSQCGLAMLELKAWIDAEPLLRQCLAIRQAKSPDAWITFNSQSLLGGALLGQKKYADAESQLVEGFEGMKQREKSIPPTGKVRLPEALDRLIQLYTETNKPDEVKKWQVEKGRLPKPAPIKK